MLTIIMYHYVRDLPNTNWPRIKGLVPSEFEAQLDYLSHHYTIVGMQDVIAAHTGDQKLPSNPCVLTFDDGLIDHYENVFPILKGRGIVGCFYPSAKPLLEHVVMDAHKLHFILASVIDPKLIMDRILVALPKYRDKFDIPTDEALKAAYLHSDRFNSREVGFTKRVLQHGLPQWIRHELIAEFFTEFVTNDETGFAQNLYPSCDQLLEMSQSGMEIGGHGYRHEWLEHMQISEQKVEIKKSKKFVQTVCNIQASNLVFCYPYGSYNCDTVALLKSDEWGAALTTNTGTNSIGNDILQLRRLDTMDVPPLSDST